MDCCICSPMAAVFRPPRNTICLSCYEAARNMDCLLNKVDGRDGEVQNPKPSSGSQPKSMKSLADVFKWMEERQKVEEELNEKLRFLESFSVAFREGIHTDIMINPGSGPPIAAHRALLATKSEIFRNMLGLDECKAPAGDAISLPELTHNQLNSFLDFLYSGSLSEDEAGDHTYTLLLASDKYNVSFLRWLCERRILGSLGPSNALDVLEVSETCSSTTLKEAAIGLITKNVEDIVFSRGFDEFATKNAHLFVEVVRTVVRDMRERKEVGAV